MRQQRNMQQRQRQRPQQQQQQTFHAAIGGALYVSQIFALLPVSNVLGGDAGALRYSWLSARCLYTTLIFVLNALEFLTVMNLVCSKGLNFQAMDPLALFVVCLLEHVYFWLLAIKWPSIMRTWQRIEQTYLQPPYLQYATNSMKMHINAIVAVIMLCALLEHVLLGFNSWHNTELEHMQCQLNVSNWQSFYQRQRPHLALLIPYSVWTLPVFEWINLTLAYVRSFTDAFIICISIGLAERYRQLHLRIWDVHTKHLPALFWREVRQHYLQLQRLVRVMNHSTAPLILLGCINNMYFICFQLFNSFQNIGVNLVAMLAFWYSLLFAIARTLLTLFMASLVHDNSKNILAALRDIPSSSWCLEVQRFSEQLAVETTALSGLGFFNLTRTLILAMTSTVVTYEVLLAGVVSNGALIQSTNYCK